VTDETTGILDICLAEMAAGVSAEASLARYPEQAAELAPLLATAAELRRLHDYTMPAEQWSRVQATLMATDAQGTREASRDDWAQMPRGSGKGAGWLASVLAVMHRPVKDVARVAAASLVLLLVLSATATAASQPGSLPYGWRLAAERIPVYLAITPLSRGTMELRYADRRLTDPEKRGLISARSTA
jgi:hypothetical protein